jgi:hypothetical protein
MGTYPSIAFGTIGYDSFDFFVREKPPGLVKKTVAIQPGCDDRHNTNWKNQCPTAGVFKVPSENFVVTQGEGAGSPLALSERKRVRKRPATSPRGTEIFCWVCFFGSFFAQAKNEHIRAC